MDMVETNTITPREGFILANVDALMRTNSGCYASNQYLGKMVGLKARMAQVAISKLMDLGLLINVGTKQNRQLETSWGRVPHKGAQLNAREAQPNAHYISEFKSGVLSHPLSGDVTAAGEGKLSTPQNEQSMPFFDKPKEKPTAPTDYDTQRATVLRTCLTAKATTTPTWYVSRWANQFKLLRTKDLYPDDEISAVLQWLVLHCGEKFTPTVYTAEEFRKKFPRLLAAYKREKALTVVPEEEVLSEVGRKMCERLEAHNPWPKGSKALVARTLGRSLAAMKKFRERLKAFDTTTLTDTLRREQLRNIGHARDQVLDRLSSHYIEIWMRRCCDKVKNWDEWSGDLLAMAWAPEEKMFQQDARQWITDYTGRPEGWELLWEALSAG